VYELMKDDGGRGVVKVARSASASIEKQFDAEITALRKLDRVVGVPWGEQLEERIVESPVAGSMKCPVLLLDGPVGTSMVDAVRSCESEVAGDALAKKVALANRVVKAILAILHEAHARDIIHCDVRPANIVWSERDGNTVYLVDWGVSRKRGHSARSIGVPAYAAPGVFAQAANPASPAMDVCGALCTWIAIVHGGAVVEVPWIAASPDFAVDDARRHWLERSIRAGLVGARQVWARLYDESDALDDYEFSVVAEAPSAAEGASAAAGASASVDVAAEASASAPVAAALPSATPAD
jgi:hypothetical protein